MRVEVLENFINVARKAYRFDEGRSDVEHGTAHPFDERNVHPDIAKVSKKLFDNGHYAQATFEAFKLLDKRIQKLSKCNESGVKLMMKAFNESKPLIQLADLTSQTSKDEQEGYKFMFSGSVMAIRNPRGHEPGISESPSQCLDYLGLASLLLRRVEMPSVKLCTS
ncbi:MAG TPA: TIGR02391 family protein [Rhodanobacter sp.]